MSEKKKSSAKSSGSAQRQSHASKAAGKSSGKSSGRSSGKSAASVSGRSAARSSGKAAESKAMQAARDSEEEARQRQTRKYLIKLICGCVSALLALFLLLSLIGVHAVILDALANLTKGLLGYGFWFMPFILAFIAWLLFYKFDQPARVRAIAFLLGDVFLAALLHAILYRADTGEAVSLVKVLWTSGMEVKSGGVIAGLLAQLLVKLFSRYGAIPLLLIFNLGWFAVAFWIALPLLLHKTADKRKETRERLQQEAEQRMQQALEDGIEVNQAIAEPYVPTRESVVQDFKTVFTPMRQQVPEYYQVQKAVKQAEKTARKAEQSANQDSQVFDFNNPDKDKIQEEKSSKKNDKSQESSGEIFDYNNPNRVSKHDSQESKTTVEYSEQQIHIDDLTSPKFYQNNALNQQDKYAALLKDDYTVDVQREVREVLGETCGSRPRHVYFERTDSADKNLLTSEPILMVDSFDDEVVNQSQQKNNKSSTVKPSPRYKNTSDVNVSAKEPIIIRSSCYGKYNLKEDRAFTSVFDESAWDKIDETPKAQKKLQETPEPQEPADILPESAPITASSAPLTEESIEAAAEEAKRTDSVSGKDAAAAEAEVAEEIRDQLSKDPGASYRFPSTDFLTATDHSRDNGTEEDRQNIQSLETTLGSFGVDIKIDTVVRGPTVTRYEMQLKPGVKMSKITSLHEDIALSLGVTSVRVAAVPGKSSVIGIEVPNRVVTSVPIREVLESKAFRTAKSPLSFTVGKDIGGNYIVGDISKMPHMLIAGTTGSGKSVCMNSIIVSLLYRTEPKDCRLIMIDPKVVELSIYNGIPHLLIPVVTDAKKAAGALQWAVTEMERRYRALADNNVRDLSGYNKIAKEDPNMDVMPQIVIIIDELADLMLVAGKEVENSIVRIAQKARAAGMYLVIATQRPSTDVITGVMKANIPSRIAFAVSSAIDSRIILDEGGAEKLVGKGDMLYAPIGAGKPTRVQGCFITDDEVEQIVAQVKQSSEAQYDEDIQRQIDSNSAASAQEEEDKSDGIVSSSGEPLDEAVQVLIEAKQASVSMLQRRMKLGYAHAARIMDELEELGVVGPFEGSKPRQVLVTWDQWQIMRTGSVQEAEPQLSLMDEPEDEE